MLSWRIRNILVRKAVKMAELRDYIKVKHGFAFKGDHITTNDNGIVLVTPGNFSISGGFKEEKCKFFDGEYPTDYVLRPGDLIVTMTDLSKAIDTLGYSALVPKSERTYLHNQRIGLVKIIDEKGLDKHYLYWFMRTSYYQKTIAATSSGSTVHHTSPDRIMDVEIELPDLEKQRAVATFMDNIESKINTNKQINKNLLEQALAIYKDWFCDYALSDGILPENWKITTIGAISSLVTRGIAPKYDDSSDQIVLNQKCIRDQTIDISLSRRHLPKKINEKWISKGDLLINSTGTGTLGRVAQVWFEANNMTVDSHVTIVRPKDPILQSYIGFWGLSHESEIEAQHTGSTGQTELPRDRVKAMELPLPDEDTLSKFNELVIPMTSTVISNQEENARLSQLRDALLPKLMSGELDVSGINI